MTQSESFSAKLLRIRLQRDAAPEGGTPAPAPQVEPATTVASGPEAGLSDAPAPEGSALSMWDVLDDLDAAPPSPVAPSAEPSHSMPTPVAAASPEAEPEPSTVWDAETLPSAEASLPEVAAIVPRRTGRVKTRLLGIDHASGPNVDLTNREAAPAAETVRFPAGWLVVVAGPGRGASFALGQGMSQIGRGENQQVCLDFGDMAISREGHAVLAYDEETRSFYVGHGGKANIVRLNGRPLLSTEQIRHGDRIRVGETTLMLVALCGESFTWADTGPAGPSAG